MMESTECSIREGFSGQHMHKMRIALDYTPRQAAAIAECKTWAWLDWERGVDDPSDWWLGHIARTLKCTKQDLMW